MSLSDSTIRTLYRQLVENQPDLICRFLPDTTLTFVNKAYADFFAKSPEELVGSKFIEFIPEDDRAGVMELLATFSPEKPSHRYAHPSRGGDAKVYWHLWHDYAFFDEDGRPAEFQSVGIDITLQKRVEARMEEVSRLFLSLGKDFDQDVARLTAFFGQLLGADTALYNRKQDGHLFSHGIYRPLPGYDPVKIPEGQICKHLLDAGTDRTTVIHHLSRSRFASSNPDVLAFGFETYVGHPVFLRGQAIGVLCALFHRHVEVLPEDEHFLALLAYALGEQEERALALAEQRKLQAELALAQNIESVGRLAGSIAHDFNNQLTVITGLAQLLLMNGEDGGEAPEEAADILTASRCATQLTNKLLSFTCRQPSSPIALNLNESIKAMLPLWQQSADKARLQWHPGADLWGVRLDPTHLDQILANLLVNAHEAISPGGRIELETANLTLSDADLNRPGDLSAGDYVVIRVRDDGSGMEPEIMARIFEPFYTTKPGGIGTGLGLSTVFGIVKQNQGAITVESRPGQGTTFTVFLPRHAAPTTSVHPPATTGAILGRGERILLVEDEPAVLKLARRILEKSGFSVLPANGPAEALRLAKEHAGQIDLVLTDVMMPEINGPTLVERLLAEDPSLKWLFMSGFTADVLQNKSALTKGAPLLRKPFSVEKLIGAVRTALDARQDNAAAAL